MRRTQVLIRKCASVWDWAGTGWRECGVQGGRQGTGADNDVHLAGTECS